jgi:hypothetical protein
VATKEVLSKPTSHAARRRSLPARPGDFTPEATPARAA